MRKNEEIMAEQEMREKVIKELECCVSLNHNGLKCANCDYADEFHNGDCETYLLSDALALLKEYEKATIEPKRIDLADETKAWLDKLSAVDALRNIADICMDWDGYRTANGLGELINEIWAYARYCADRLQKTQKPRVMTLEEAKSASGYVIVQSRSCNILELQLIKDGFVYDSFTVPIAVDDLWWEGYNKHWRLWTSAPTDEQMEATSWN